jgi:hypothetical protein
MLRLLLRMVVLLQVDLLLRGLKEGFVQLLTAAGCVPTLAGEQPEAAAAQQATTTTTVYVSLPRCIIENKEPFAHVEWRKAPYEARSYQELTDYEIRTNDPNEVEEAGVEHEGRWEGEGVEEREQETWQGYGGEQILGQERRVKGC